MARTRYIKPAFFKNEDLAELCFENRLFFIALWTLADCNGRVEFRPKRLKIEVFPYDQNIDIKKLAINLERYGFIRFYSVQEKDYIDIVNFSKHQNIHKNEKEKGGSCPSPEEGVPRSYINQGFSEESEKIAINHEQYGTDRAFNLEPLTLNLEPNILSGKPDDGILCAEKKHSSGKKFEIENQAKEIIEFLNLKTGKNFHPAKSNLRLVEALLREPYTLRQITDVIADKVAEWKDTAMNIYLRPKTLFNKTNFDNYVGDIGGGQRQAEQRKQQNSKQQKLSTTDRAHEAYKQYLIDEGIEPDQPANYSDYNGGETIDGEILASNGINERSNLD